MPRIIVFLLLAGGILGAGGAMAEYAITASELRLLPKFCRHLSPGNFAPDAKRMAIKGKMPGEHAHHFCHGMKYLVRARRAMTDKQARKEALNGAIGEFTYVETHTKNPRGVLLPYVALYKGEALSQLGRRQEALREYIKAIRLRPKLAQAYAKLAQLYIDMGMQDKAIKVLRYGIRKTKAKSLKRKLQRISQGK